MSQTKQRRFGRLSLLFAAAAVVGGSLLALTLSMPDAPDSPAPAASDTPQAAHALPKRQLSRLEQAAAARFAGARPRVRVPGGKMLEPSSDEHALAIEVNVFKGVLVREEEKRDPTFRLRAEAELNKRQPARASVLWEDLSGNREMVFTIENSIACGLTTEDLKLSLTPDEIGAYPCLDRENLWEEGTKLTVEIEPVGRGESLWSELLRDLLKEMAAEAYLARAETGPER